MINVKFSPNSRNPSFIIEDSWKITSEEDQLIVLQYIMHSDFYSRDIYQRTLDSMLVEWKAHNFLYKKFGHWRLKDTDFDKEQEGVTFVGFVMIAVFEYIKEKIS